MTALLFLLTLFATDNRNTPPKRPLLARPMTACALVSRADVEQAIGRPVGDGTESSEGASSTCDYESPDGLVTIAVQQLSAKPDLEAEMAALRKELPAGATRRAKGFEAAFFFEVPQIGIQLHVMTGQQEHVMVSVGGFGGPARTTAATEQIARKAIGRL